MTPAHTERAGACAQPPCLNFPAASVAGLFLLLSGLGFGPVPNAAHNFNSGDDAGLREARPTPEGPSQPIPRAAFDLFRAE